MPIQIDRQAADAMAQRFDEALEQYGAYSNPQRIR